VGSIKIQEPEENGEGDIAKGLWADASSNSNQERIDPPLQRRDRKLTARAPRRLRSDHLDSPFAEGHIQRGEAAAVKAVKERVLVSAGSVAMHPHKYCAYPLFSACSQPKLLKVAGKVDGKLGRGLHGWLNDPNVNSDFCVFRGRQKSKAATMIILPESCSSLFPLTLLASSKTSSRV
jgi:hypothetical protein